MRILPIALLLAAACSNDPAAPVEPVQFSFDFHTEAVWAADFTDFAAAQEAAIEFVADRRPLPAPLDQSRQALYHTGQNLSDDLFMYFKRQVSGLVPGRTYRARITMLIASPSGAGCDIGPSSIWVKAGASTQEPARTVVDGYVRLSVDKGEQQNEGSAALILGDIRNTLPGCPSPGVWGTKALTSGTRSIRVTATAQGTVWLFFGTESGFEIGHETAFLEFGVVMTAE